MEDVEYYCELSDIRRFLERNVEDFPFNKCQVASRFLNLELGLEEVAGIYFNLNGGRIFHSWNYDSERKLYVDLTRDQFLDKDNEKITVLSTKDEILVPLKSSTQSQRNLKFENLNFEILQEIYKYSKITS